MNSFTRSIACGSMLSDYGEVSDRRRAAETSGDRSNEY